jgi:predicted negative regulator of RcsB-dependent stress response
MKSVERHKLETNVLAHGLEVWIDRYRPYIATVAYAVLGLIAVVFIWSYISGSSAAEKSEAWDSYNFAVGSQPMNLEMLRQAAEAYPGTEMQQLADVTWADGQLFTASNTYIANRPGANEALTRAASAYQRVIQESKDARIKSRAQLGLARVYEMQADVDKARAAYEQVAGPYAKYAKTQAERLATPESKDIYSWLKTAQAPRPVAPMGPGTPGQRPEFSPGDLSLPNGGAEGASTSGENKSAADTFDALLKDMQKDAKPGAPEDNRYKADEQPASDATPAEPAGVAPPSESKVGEEPAATEDSSKDSPASTSPADSK